MKLNVIVTIQIVLFAITASGQKLKSHNSMVSFYSHAPMEDIRAENSASTGIYDKATHDVGFSIPIRDFTFAKSLMQEHFNEKYLESDQYPKATFTGKLIGSEEGQPSQDVKASGKLTIHGVTKDVEIPGKLSVKGDGVNMHAVFTVKLEDYKIKIPQIVWQNIAEQVEVTVDFSFQ